MDTISQVRQILRDALQLGPRGDALQRDDRLLGAIPEFDSMVVVTVVTMIEERFGLTLEDDELGADAFATVGSLIDLVDSKLGNR